MFAQVARRHLGVRLSRSVFGFAVRMPMVTRTIVAVGWCGQAARMSLVTRTVLAVGLLSGVGALPACKGDPDPFPYAIESLAVLPVELQPYSQLGAQVAGDQMTAALARDTTFRVVGAQSTRRILGDPSGMALFGRFRGMALTTGAIEPTVSRIIGERCGTSGLLYMRVSTGLSGPTRGNLAINVTVYEASMGFRVWSNSRRRAFAGSPGEPAFVRVVGQCIEEIVADMPRPVGEEEP